MRSSWMATLVLALSAHGQALALRAIGDSPQPRSAAAVAPPAAPQTASGVITALQAGDPRGLWVDIDGRRWLLLNGRTSVLRDGRLADARSLAVGQTVHYTPATTTPGETALGVIHVP